MKKSRVHALVLAAFTPALLTGILSMTGCGGSSGPSPSRTNPTGTVSTFMSDPPTCSEIYSHIYVTIAAVKVNENADAGPGDGGWQTLVDLSKSPKQVDLLSLNPSTTQNFCSTLSMLGTESIPTGKYQAIMLVLLDNSASASVAGNACGVGFNCVLSSGSTATDPLDVQGNSSHQDDIVIPASAIANGGLTVTAGQSVDLNIDFDSCASILAASSGQYDLSPVLHAGEVTQTGSNTISGTVLGPGNSTPVMTGIPNTPVLLEQRDNSTTPPTDRVVWATMTDSRGVFAFCPVASDASNYDVVTAGVTASAGTQGNEMTIYNPAVLFNVPIGANAPGGVAITLFAETTSTNVYATGYPPTPELSLVGATINGQIETSGSSSGVSGSIQLYALQTLTDPDGNTVNVTIPVLSAGSTPSGNVTDSQPSVFRTVDTTSTNGGCASSSADCVAYSLIVPPGMSAIGTYHSNGGTSFNLQYPLNPATYTLTAVANGSEETLDCTSPSGGSASSGPITVTPGSSVTSASQSSLNFDLSGCTAP